MTQSMRFTKPSWGASCAYVITTFFTTLLLASWCSGWVPQHSLLMKSFSASPAIASSPCFFTFSSSFSNPQCYCINHKFTCKMSNSDMENFEEIQDEMWLERSKRWILLVDDEESIRKAVGQYLFDEGYQVTACADVDTALKVLQSGNGGTTANNNAADLENDETKSDRKQLPDAIISDICLTPQSSSTSAQINDGLKFLQFIRSHPQLVAIPVILLTAKGTIKDRIAGYDSGADAYLTKPFDPEELLVMVDNVITRHETLSGKNIQLDDLQQDLKEIKHFLLENGGASGIGNGWIQATNVYLTPAERNILKLLSQGLMNKEIAKEAFLSQRRVEQLLTSMFRKTGVSNRTELVRWAVSTGVVEL